MSPSFVYLAWGRPQRPRANLIQTLHTVEALGALGADARLYLPPVPASFDRAGFLAGMGIRGALDLRPVASLHRRWGGWPFALAHWRELRAADVVYTRVPELAFVLARLGVPHWLELHDTEPLARKGWLARLVAHGLLTRAPDPAHKQRAIYSLTEKSIALLPIIVQIGAWGSRWVPDATKLDAAARHALAERDASVKESVRYKATLHALMWSAGGAAALTLLPAILAVVGRWGWIKPRRELTARFWRRSGIRIVRRPVHYLVASLLILAILGGSALFSHYNYDDRKSVSPSASSSIGYAALERHFPIGQSIPEFILIQSPNDLRTPRALADLEQMASRVAQLPDVGLVSGITRPLGEVPPEFRATYQAGIVGVVVSDLAEPADGRTEKLDLVDRLAVIEPPFQAAQIGVGDLGVAPDREQQRDVDVDAVGDEFLDRRDAGARGRHLDHHVRPVEARGEFVRLAHGGRGVVRQVRRDFHAHVAVAAVGRAEHRQQHVGGQQHRTDAESSSSEWRNRTEPVRWHVN